MIFGHLRDLYDVPIKGDIYIGPAPIIEATTHGYSDADGFIVMGDQRDLFTKGDTIISYGPNAGTHTITGIVWASGSNATILEVQKGSLTLDINDIITKPPTYNPTSYNGDFGVPVDPGAYYVWAIADGYSDGEITGIIRSKLTGGPGNYQHAPEVVTDSPVEANLTGVAVNYSIVYTTDKMTGEALSNVHVTSTEGSDFIIDAYTGADGKLRIEGLQPGADKTYNVLCEKEGYSEEVRSLTHSLNKTKNVYMTYMAAGTGFIHASGMLYGVNKSIWSAGKQVTPYTLESEHTWELPPGEYTLKRDMANCEPFADIIVNVVASQTVDIINPPGCVPLEHSLTVHVQDPAGTAISGATVELRGAGFVVLGEGATNSSGDVIFSASHGYDYSVKASKAGYDLDVMYNIDLVTDLSVDMTLVDQNAPPTETMELSEPYYYMGVISTLITYWDQLDNVEKTYVSYLQSLGSNALTLYNNGQITKTQYDKIWVLSAGWCSEYSLEGCAPGTEYCTGEDLMCGKYRLADCSLDLDTLIEANSPSCSAGPISTVVLAVKDGYTAVAIPGASVKMYSGGTIQNDYPNGYSVVGGTLISSGITDNAGKITFTAVPYGAYLFSNTVSGYKPSVHSLAVDSPVENTVDYMNKIE